MFKKIIALILALSMFAGLTACKSAAAKTEKGETFTFTDSCGRNVELPKSITKVAPSGSVAQMVITTIAPELLVGLSATPSSAQSKYLPGYFMDLPTFGQFYGTKATLNMEALIASNPQVIIDIGDMKETEARDMDSIQKQTGIPTIFIETSLNKFAAAYRTLGKLLNKEQKGEQLASYLENTIATAKANSAKIPENKRLSVMYCTGSSGLNCMARGSLQADVIDLVGGVNAIVVNNPTGSGMGDPVGMEQLYNFNPDVIVMTTGGPFTKVGTDSTWNKLSAIQNNRYYEIPSMPYCWMSNPPSINRVLGIWWLGNLLYPDLYNYKMADKTKEFYKLFWNYDLSDTEVSALLQNSTLKRDASVK